ncbi:MAG: hypothetical protein OHK0046_10010 [Anaerolineae bacterium]
MMDVVYSRERFNPKLMSIFLGLMLMIWGGALAAWGMLDMDSAAALFIAYVGLFVGVGLGSFLAFGDRKRQMGRRIMMVMIGTLLLFVALTSDHGNMQIEGLFFGGLLLAPYIILHYALAKIVGPLIFGRVWCGWACWFGMVFDLLPYKHSRYRRPGDWGKLRYLHFGLSLVIVLTLWFAFDYQGGALGETGMVWFVGGLLLYYATGIGLAFALKDNRAFCKYLCPIAVPLKFSTRFSLLKITGLTAEHCTTCEACVEMCPMNIRVKDYVIEGERVLSTECTLCQTCIHVCPHNALTLSFGLDVGGKEHVDWEPPRPKVKDRSETP